ncbi:MAG TPA: hypothetical protein DCG38_07900 [Eubacteriaceae bacterium]|nr:hypothetical protein [Eubacteriaceae bacterium]
MKKQNKTSNRANVKIVISLIIAIVLWIYVIGDQDPRLNQRYNNIPVEIKNEDVLNSKGLILMSEAEFSVDITVNGRTSALYNLPWRNIKASIDLSGIEDKGSYELSIDIVGIPEEIDLIEISPGQIEVEVDRLSSQNRQVSVEFTGDLPNGMSLLDYSVSPQSVVIEGGEDILKSVRMVGAVVDISQESNESTKDVELKAFDADGNEISGVSIRPNQAEVMLKIGKNSNAKIVVQTTGEPAEGFSIKEISVEPNQIEIGADSDVEITEIKTEPIMLEGLDADAQIKADLIFPDGVESSDGVTSVIVTITVEKIIEKDFEVEVIDVVNLEEGLILDKNQLNKKVTVTLAGVQEMLDDISPGNLKVYADLTGISSGPATVALKIEPIRGISLVEIQPGSVELLIKEE